MISPSVESVVVPTENVHSPNRIHSHDYPAIQPGNVTTLISNHVVAGGISAWKPAHCNPRCNRAPHHCVCGRRSPHDMVDFGTP